MNKFLLAVAALLISRLAFAQEIKTTISKDTLNWSFEQNAPGKKIPGKGHLMSPNAKKYHVVVDSTVSRTGSRSLLITSIDTAIRVSYFRTGQT